MSETDQEECRCKFEAFESPELGKPVQTWFNSLLEDHRDHIKETLAVMQVMPWSDWDESENYDPLIGEGGISEIRFAEIISEQGKFCYRIYGFFDEAEGSYIFLHGTNKRKRNDKDGKRIAKQRLADLEAQEGTSSVHEFSMDAEIPDEEVGQES